MKTAIVTGATSGIGKETARALAGAGWQVIVTGRRAERLSALTDEFGALIHPAVFDVRDEAAMAAALDALPEQFRGIDLLVNNAGLALGTAPVAIGFLQRALNALNRGGNDYADVLLDGRIGAATLAALDGFLATRPGGETVLVKAVEALQGERYLTLAERRPANEAFLYGWLANRLD